MADNPVRYSAGVVAHNEAARLPRWIEAWLPVVGDDPGRLIVVLHSCSDDSAAICERYGVTPHEVNVAGLLEAILWETVPLAPPDAWHWRTGGCDEFPSEGLAEATTAVIEANPGVRLYYVARRNYVDGVDVSDLLGMDWQSDLMLPMPPPIRFRGGIHARPELVLHGSAVGLLDPAVGHIRHERTQEEVERCNRARAGYASPQMATAQERFIEAVRNRLNAARSGGGAGK